MTLVFVAKEMQVVNPVGMVNIHPLPDLPPGLQRAHLMRHSLTASAVNLVDGETTGLHHIDLNGDVPGNLTYTDTYAHTDYATTGWYDEEWPFPWEEGFTWLSVYQSFQPEGGASGYRLFSSGDYVNVSGGLINLMVSHKNERVRVGSQGIGGYNSADVDTSARPAMVFATVDGTSEQKGVFVPHTGASSEGSFTTPDPFPSVPGVSMAAAYGNPGNFPADHKLFLAAQWDRVLSQSEMATAYAALKPWLLARGVTIA